MWHRPSGLRSPVQQEKERHLVRMTAKAPYNIIYADIEYRISPVAVISENVSYIAARMVKPNGRLHRPMYEHQLSSRFPSASGAREAWKKGFESTSDLFLCRAIIEKLLDDGLAEFLPLASVP